MTAVFGLCNNLIEAVQENLVTRLQVAARPTHYGARSDALIARGFDGQGEGLTRDDILDNITLYWLTETGVSSRLYWENKLAFFAPRLP